MTWLRTVRTTDANGQLMSSTCPNCYASLVPQVSRAPHVAVHGGAAIHEQAKAQPRAVANCAGLGFDDRGSEATATSPSPNTLRGLNHNGTTTE